MRKRTWKRTNLESLGSRRQKNYFFFKNPTECQKHENSYSLLTHFFLLILKIFTFQFRSFRVFSIERNNKSEFISCNFFLSLPISAECSLALRNCWIWLIWRGRQSRSIASSSSWLSLKRRVALCLSEYLIMVISMISRCRHASLISTMYFKLLAKDVRKMCQTFMRFTRSKPHFKNIYYFRIALAVYKPPLAMRENVKVSLI